MKTVTVKDIKNNGSKAIPNDEVSYLVVNSELKSALVPIDQYESYVESMEELDDINATLQRMQEENISADKLFAELLSTNK